MKKWKNTIEYQAITWVDEKFCFDEIYDRVQPEYVASKYLRSRYGKIKTNAHKASKRPREQTQRQDDTKPIQTNVLQT